MTSLFGKIGHGLEHLGQQVGDEAKKLVTGDPKPDPRQFSNGTPVTTTQSNLSNLPGGSGNPLGGSSPSLPIAGGRSSGLSQLQQNQLYNAARNSPDLAGIFQTIGDDVGKVGDFLGQFLPHSQDGSIDWGKVGGDIVGFLHDNAKTIINGLSAYEQYQRQGKADAYLQQALNGIPGTDYKGAIANYSAKQPLRDAGQAGMLNPRANTPDLSALKTQGQAGAGLTASLPISNPNQAQGMTNLRNIAGSGSGNPFASSLPVASASQPSLPSVTPPRQPPALPIGPQSPSLNPVPTPPGGPKPGQIAMPSLPVVPPVPPVGAPTTTSTQAKKGLGSGLYSAQGVTPLDENPDGLLPYGPDGRLRLNIAGA
jgi:hypothetical protein